MDDRPDKAAHRALRLVERDRVGPSAIRVRAALHAQLVAVVDRRRPGQNQLENRRQAKRRLVAGQDGSSTRRVVTADQVVLDCRRGRVVQREQVAQPVAERRSVEGMEEAPVVGLAVDRALIQPARAREPEDGQPEGVVHQGVEAIAHQPLG